MQVSRKNVENGEGGTETTVFKKYVQGGGWREKKARISQLLNNYSEYRKDFSI